MTISKAVAATWTSAEARAFGCAFADARPSWLGVPQLERTSAGSGTVTFTVYPTDTPVGTYTTKVLVGIGRTADLSSTIGYQVVEVTLFVKSAGVVPDELAVRSVWGSSVAPAPQTLWVTAATAAAFTASADRPWIRLSTVAGTTPAALTVDVDPALVGTRSGAGNVTVSIGGAVSIVPVQYTIVDPTFTVTPTPQLDLAGPAGRDLSPKQVTVSLDTGTHTYPLTILAPDWLEIPSRPTGVSGAGVTFTVKPSMAAAARAAGTYGGAITLTAVVDGIAVSRRLPVSYVLTENRLLVDTVGVALTAAPGLSALRREVRVSTSRGLDPSWAATTDAAWLDATPLGSTGPLVLTANPTGLAPGALHEATVTVRSRDGGAAGTETIRVGLWVVVAAIPDPVVAVSTSVFAIAADPVRPLAYVTDGTSAIGVWHVHSGVRTATIPIPGTSLYGLTVSGDGATLYAVDVTDVTGGKVIPVDLRSRAAAAPWSLPWRAFSSTTLAWARPNGVPVIVTSQGTFHSPATGALLATLGAHDRVAVSRDGTRLCSISAPGGAPYLLECFAMDATPAGAVFVGPMHWGFFSFAGEGRDVALSPDGTRAWAVSDDIREWDATGAGDLVRLGTLPVTGSTSAIEEAGGRLYCGTSGVPETVQIVENGGVVGSASIGDVTRGQLAVSGDRRRVVAGTGTLWQSVNLTFATVP